MNDIIIYGAGGLGMEISWLIDKINKHQKIWNLVGHIDDYVAPGTAINNSFVIGDFQWLLDKKCYKNIVVAVANPVIKKKLIKSLAILGYTFPNIIHPSVLISELSKIGSGCVILDLVNISTHVYIGNHVLIDLKTTIGHESTISDYTSIFPGAIISGNVNISEEVIIGAGAIILQNINVGKKSIVGAGAVVTKDVSESSIAIGVPAREKSIDMEMMNHDK